MLPDINNNNVQKRYKMISFANYIFLSEWKLNISIMPQ